MSTQEKAVAAPPKAAAAGTQQPLHPTKTETAPAAFRRGPLAFFEGLRHELYSFLEKGWPSLFPPAPFEGVDWTPRIDAFRSNGDLVVKADLPGLEKDEVHVTLEEGDLIVEGERKLESEVKEKGFYRHECTYGSFYRRLPLDFPVAADQVKAKFDNGVLEVRLPMPAAKAPAANTIPVS